MQFTLKDAATGGNTIGVPVALAPLAVSNGLFTATLDFDGAAFTGAARWLEIGVRTNGSVAAYTVLTPRQALTPTPYAMLAGTAASVPAANLSGTVSTSQLPANVARLDVNETFTGQVNFNGGNVGIGTTQPQSKLDVLGNASIDYLTVRPQSPSTREGGEILLRGTTNYADWYLDIGYDQFRIRNSHGLTSFVANTNGNVGIGTTSPSAILDVGGRMRVRGDNAAATAGMWLSMNALGTDRAFIGMDSPELVGFFGNTGGGWGLRMDTTTGNVGIGTPTPSQKLTVAGTVQSTTGGFKFPDGSVQTTASSSGSNSLSGSGAAGYLSKFTASSALGNSSAYADSAGNVGIGTNAPAKRLHVVSSTNANDGLLVEGRGNLVSLKSLDDNHWFNVNLWNDGTTRFYDSQDNGTNSTMNLAFKDGNVGIGVTQPQARLDVGGTMRVRGDKGGVGATAGMWLRDIVSNSDLAFIGMDNTSLRFGGSELVGFFGNTGGGWGLRMDTTTGNVGIGTSTPSQKLTVAGTVQSTTGGFKFPDGSVQTTASFSVSNSLSGSGTAGYLSKFTASSALGDSSAYSDSAGNVGIGTNAPTRRLHVVSSTNANDGILVEGRGNLVSLKSLDDNHRFNVNLWNDGTTRFYDSQDNGTNWAMNLAFKNGNIGIGTNNPSQKLTVAGLVESLNGGFKFPDGTVQTTATGGSMGGSGTSGYLPKFTGSTTLGNSPVWTDSTNVGIGTNSPTVKLDVAGQIRSSFDNDEGGQLTLNNPRKSGAAARDWKLFNMTAAYGDSFQLWNYPVSGGAYSRFRINDDGTTILSPSGGNVGVGTTSPAQKLSVAGVVESTSGGFKFPDGSVQTKASSGSGGVGGSGTAGYLPKFTAATTVGNSSIFVDGSGNVGIGTSAPGAKLQVAGDAIIGSTFIYGYGAMELGGTPGSPASYIDFHRPEGEAQDFNFRLINDGPNRLTAVGDIAVTGSVGIGTASPDARLLVEGTGTEPGGTAKFSAPSKGPYPSHVQFGQTGDWYVRSASASGKVVIQDSGGNVGIGTDNPQAKLEVAGDLKLSASAARTISAEYRLHISAQEQLYLNPWAGSGSVIVGGGGGQGDLVVVGTTYAGGGGVAFPDGSVMTSAMGLTESIPVQIEVYSVGNHTWAVPSGVTRVRFRVWGAGGGGSSTTSGGGGGGGGAFAQVVVTGCVTGESFDLVIGGGGGLNSSGAQSSVVRRNGGATLAIARGGAGGSGASGGAGGSATAGQIRRTGNAGDAWADGSAGGGAIGTDLSIAGTYGFGGIGSDPESGWSAEQGASGYILIEY
jgi:hypothetical protein